MSIRSGDICDQSRKLSEMAPNYGFLGFPIFRGRAFQKLYTVITAASRTLHGKVS